MNIEGEVNLLGDIYKGFLGDGLLAFVFLRKQANGDLKDTGQRSNLSDSIKILWFGLIS